MKCSKSCSKKVSFSLGDPTFLEENLKEYNPQHNQRSSKYLKKWLHRIKAFKSRWKTNSTHTQTTYLTKTRFAKNCTGPRTSFSQRTICFQEVITFTDIRSVEREYKLLAVIFHRCLMACNSQKLNQNSGTAVETSNAPP